MLGRSALACLPIMFALAATGCGGDGPEGAAPEPGSGDSIQRVVDALQLTPKPGAQPTDDPVDSAWDEPTKCGVIVVLTGAADVQTYIDAGDPVATNENRSVGVKYRVEPGGDLSTCHRIFTERLAKLK
ncbi:MAG: hypothetical protein AB7G37_01055 [Solirubrobacteraceae bacterium]